MARKGKESYDSKKSSNNSPKGNRKYGKRGRGSADNDFASDRSTHNDVSWYVPDGQILKDVASLPYSIPTGMPISRGYEAQGTQGMDWAVPGVLVQKVMPTLGYAKNPGDPVNVAAQGIYSFVRHLNSGSRNYDPVDMMIYIGCLDSVYSVISWATRIYATICSYAQGNRYLPRVLLESQGLDFDNFANNMVAFRSQLNQRIAKASQLMVPKIMPIFERHRWLFSNYYIEGDDIKDQIYLYAPVGFYKYTLDSDSAGMMEAVALTSIRSALKYTDVIQLLDDMLDPIIADEDFNIMSGDIYKAYQGNIVTYSMVPELIAMNFTYDENVLLQFKNSKSIPVGRDNDGKFVNQFFNYHQDTTKSYLQMAWSNGALKGVFDPFLGWIPYDSTWSSFQKQRQQDTFRVWTKPTMLTSPHRDVDAAENMVSSRGTMAMDPTLDANPNNSRCDVGYFGSEWYESFEIWTGVRRRNTGVVVFAGLPLVYANSLGLDFDNQGATEVEFWISRVIYETANLAKFKYHPEVWLLFNGVQNGTDMSNILETNSYFEIDNYSVIDKNVVKAMHDAALLGEYNVPRIALLPS